MTHWLDEEKQQKRRDAFNVFYESVLKPDPALREDAHEQLCYHELMEWRSEVLRHLDIMRNQEFG